MSKHKEKSLGIVMPHFQDGAYFYAKGIEAYREKNLTKAKRHLERAVQLERTEPAYLCQLAIIYADLGEFYQSNECLLEITKNNDGNEMPECYFFLANNYANLGLFEHARMQALLYIEKDPDGDFLEDVEDLLELLQDDDDLFAEAESFLIRYELAVHELKSENYEKAIQYFTELIKENPTYWAAHIRLSEAYFNSRNEQKAIRILESVLTKDENVTARAQLMTYYYETKQWEKTNFLMETLTNVWPLEIENAYTIAISFGKVGAHELAYHRLEKLQQKGFGDAPKFYYHMAAASFYTGRLDKAITLWKKLATLGNDEAITHLNFLQSGSNPQPTYHYRSQIID